MNLLPRGLFLVVAGFCSAAYADGMLVRNRMKLELPPNRGGFYVFAFAPDGATIAGGTGLLKINVEANTTSHLGGEVHLWDAHSGKLLKTLGKHGDIVQHLLFSRDGQTLVSSSGREGTAKVWDMPAGKLRHTLHITNVDQVSGNRWPLFALSDDGSTLATVNYQAGLVIDKIRLASGGELIVWDLKTGKQRWSKPDSHLSAIVLTPNGRGLVGMKAQTDELPNDEQGRRRYRTEVALQSWNAATGKVTSTVDLTQNVGNVQKIALRDQNKTVAIESFIGISLRDRLTGEETGKVEWDSTLFIGNTAKFSADGKSIGRDNRDFLEIIDATTGKSKGLLEQKPHYDFTNVCFSPDLKRTVGYQGGPDGRRMPVVLDLELAAEN